MQWMSFDGWTLVLRDLRNQSEKLRWEFEVHHRLMYWLSQEMRYKQSK